MTEIYLICHKVRGKPAFDCAERMECPECHGSGELHWARNATDLSCTECDSLGYWWIVGTSGHRAYPYGDQVLLSELLWSPDEARVLGSVHEIALQQEMPSSIPDHYHHTASPATVRARLEDLLSALPSTPTTPFKRRF